MAHQTKRILIVDDEALVLCDLTMTVEDFGYDVFCDATTLDDAFASLANGTPDAALLDIDVGGTLVWPLARELDARDCPITFVSANSAHEELANEFAHCRFIDKPASKAQIGHALEIALEADSPRIRASGGRS